MKKILFTLIIIHCSLLIANAQWYQQNSGTNQNLYDVKFINKNTGWALGDAGIVIKTTNGGINWIIMPNPTLNKPLTTICPIDSNVVYFVGAHSTYIKTTNGGTTWIEIRNGPYGSGMGFESVYFLNKDTGWVCGNMRVLRTTNGGLTFDSAGIFWGSLHNIYFKDFYNGVICGDGVVFKTTNGGLNWFNTNVPTNGTYPMFERIGVAERNYLWVCGDPKVFKSTNFGTSWNIVDTIVGGGAVGIYFVNKDTGFFGAGLNTLVKTTDGGYSWHQENTGTGVQAFISAVNFATDSIGWYVSAIGKIFHTKTGGQPLTIISSTQGTLPNQFELFQNYPNPFNSQTNIEFEVKETAIYKLEIIDMLGRKIEELINLNIKPGKYRFTYAAENLSSGTYFYRLQSDKMSLTKSLILIK